MQTSLRRTRLGVALIILLFTLPACGSNPATNQPTTGQPTDQPTATATDQPTTGVQPTATAGVPSSSEPTSPEPIDPSDPFAALTDADINPPR